MVLFFYILWGIIHIDFSHLTFLKYKLKYTVCFRHRGEIRYERSLRKSEHSNSVQSCDEDTAGGGKDLRQFSPGCISSLGNNLQLLESDKTILTETQRCVGPSGLKYYFFCILDLILYFYIRPVVLFGS